MSECIIVSKKNQIMEQDYREKLTSVEQLALFVEQKCNMGNAAWAVVYFLAALVLLVELGAAFVLLSFDLQAIPRYTRAADGRGRAFGRAVIVLDSHTDYQHGLLHIPSGCSCGSHAADRVFLPAETQEM